jgi:hypothetical protein
MRNILAVAMPEEYDNPDILLGIGEKKCKESLRNYLQSLTCYHRLLTRIVNYGSCGTYISGLRGLHQITTFKHGNIILGNNMGLTLLSQDKYVTKKVVSQNISNPDLIDCEAFFLKEICDKFHVEFVCYKYITDEVGNNNIKDLYNNLEIGKKHFKEFYDR